jgi:hypothetical protein
MLAQPLPVPKGGVATSTLGGRMNIPIPSLTGGAATALGGTTAPTYFGNQTQGGGFGMWGLIAVAVLVGGALLWKKI